jgi:hypothetical protein
MMWMRHSLVFIRLPMRPLRRDGTPTMLYPRFQGQWPSRISIFRHACSETLRTIFARSGRFSSAVLWSIRPVSQDGQARSAGTRGANKACKLENFSRHRRFCLFFPLPAEFISLSTKVAKHCLSVAKAVCLRYNNIGVQQISVGAHRH